MLFKDTAYLELCQPFCSVERNHLCNYSREYNEGQICEIIFKFRPVIKGEMSFKYISYLELWKPFCSAERNHLCNYDKQCYEEQFCEVILNLGQWLRRNVV